MEFKEFSCIYSLKKIWKELVDESSKNIYQSYEFNVLYYKYRITSISNIKKRNTKCRFIVAYENGEAKCIAPLAIDNFPEKTIRLLGHGTNAGYLDYIYRDPNYVKILYNYIEKKYSGYRFDYIFVRENSPLSDIMKPCGIFNNYAIMFKEYETYFASLSKSTRQNIRTAYNRIKSDGMNFEFKVYNSFQTLGKEKLNLLNRIYHKRKADWNDGKIIDERTQRKFLKRDVIYVGLKKMTNPIVAILTIDSGVAAFFIGFSYDGGICIPRLAIDTDYGRYSPGMILINEYLKSLPCNQEYIFDLCRGDEKYKSSLGGVKSITYRLTKR